MKVLEYPFNVIVADGVTVGAVRVTWATLVVLSCVRKKITPNGVIFFHAKRLRYSHRSAHLSFVDELL